MDIEEIYNFEAKIENVRFYSDETNYHVMLFSTTKNIPYLEQKYFGKVGTLVGYCVKCEEGDRCKVTAKLTVHPKWGPQYVIESLTFDKPMDRKSLYNFLSAIIPESQATVLYNAYPDIVERVMDNNNFVPDYKILRGIKEKTWEKIRTKIIESLGYAELITLLAPVGCTLHMIKKIAVGEKNISLLKQKIIDNPYILCDIPMMGFKKVDGFAIKLNPAIADSKMRVKACINYILEMQESDTGQSFMSIDDLKKEFKRIIYSDIPYKKLQEYLEEERATFEKDYKKAFLFVQDDKVGLVKTYMMEKYIFEKLRELSTEDNIWELSYKYFCDQIDITAKKQGFYLSEEQINAVRSVANNNITIISGKAGCVDCDTEYFNGTDWVRIADYKQGDKVLQYNVETGEASLAYPTIYHKYPCEQLWHFETKYGLDQCLCDNHNILYMTSKGHITKKIFSDFKKQHEQSVIGFQGRFLTSFIYSGDGIDLTDDEIRIMVAVIADGSFYYQANEDWNSYYRCRFHLKKERKQVRLRKILKNANYEWTETKSKSNGYIDFYIDAPRREKIFTRDYWYNCNHHQLQIICEELSYWDGAIDDIKSKDIRRFFTNIKETADFAQFVYSACGYRATITALDRRGQEHSVDNKIYEYKTVEYRVIATSRNLVGMTRKCFDGKEKVQIEPYKTKDGYKYCFTMPLGTLILRRNNKIFITGNCGKTSVIKAILEVYKNHSIGMAALSAKAAKRMREVTGFENAMTIHKMLSYKEGLGFEFNERNPLPYDLLILDECSMNNIYLFYSVFKSLRKDVKIILSGDYAQLPSIGVGSVFSDLIKYPYFNNHNLTKIYRQSDKSFIVEHANVIREGIMPFDIKQGNMFFGEDTLYLFRNTSEQIRDNAVNLFLEFLKKTDIKDISIVCPRKDKVCVSCESINNMIQDELLPDEKYIELGDKVFKKGCRVINKKNDYKKGVLNGDLGTVIDINDKGSKFVVLFDEGNSVEFTRSEMEFLELGYAISVHSSQGSQYNVCIVAMDMTSFVLLSSNMVYTAMTRAIKTLIVISQPSSFCKAVKNVEENNRNTFLKLFLNNYDNYEIYENKKSQVHNHSPYIDNQNLIRINPPLISLEEKKWEDILVEESPF